MVLNKIHRSDFSKSYMPQEILPNQEGVRLTRLHFAKEMLIMELVDILNVPENDIPLPSQRLWNVFSVQLWDVVVDDELQRSHVISFRLYHFTCDQRQGPEQQTIKHYKYMKYKKKSRLSCT